MRIYRNFCVLDHPPRLDATLRIGSTFFTDASEAELKPNLKELSYNFRGVGSRLDAGLQILHVAGWRLDCASADRGNVGRVLPPPDPRNYVTSRK